MANLEHMNVHRRRDSATGFQFLEFLPQVAPGN
jgi:hypothetical protein